MLLQDKNLTQLEAQDLDTIKQNELEFQNAINRIMSLTSVLMK